VRRQATQRLFDSLWRDLSPTTAYFLALTLAIAFILHLYPIAFIAGHGRIFEEGDGAQHVAGWLFYASDSWHFPLLRTERLNHPEGISIVFTDSIPLAALLFKPFASWLPAQFHYLGLWHVVIFVTQALAATLLARALDLRHVLATFSATLFAMTWPALLFRSAGHTALMTHSIVLCALALYFLGRHGKWSSRTTTWWFVALCLVGLTVHPYFLAFSYPLFLASLADHAIAGEGWKRQWPRALVAIVAICIVGAVLGYFTSDTTTEGFGVFSMNLLAPFCSGELGYFHDCDYDATGGQYEGFNYLGLGVLLLLAFVIVTQWASVKALPRRYPALTVVSTLFFLYALSNVVYLGSHRILSYPLPPVVDQVTDTFRVSGRFFWVVGYLILFATLAALLKQPSWYSVGVLAIALPLQWMDIQPVKNRHKQVVSAPSRNDLPSWAQIMSGVEKIHLYPAYGCGNAAPDSVYRLFQRMAAHYGKLLDTGYISRPSVNCEANRKIFDAPFQARHLYVMTSDGLREPTTMPTGFSSALQHNECVQYEAVLLCQPGTTPDDWTGRASRVPVSAPIYPAR
jgi:uncharacterized protein DUF6311